MTVEDVEGYRQGEYLFGDDPSELGELIFSDNDGKGQQSR